MGPTVGRVPPSLTAALTGLAFGLSLIVAIGAQNAFVLRTGLRREHVLPVVAVCALSDAVLIAAGVAGLGTLVDQHPAVLTVARLAGAAFLLGYAVVAGRRALRPGGALTAEDGQEAPRRVWPVVATCLALTWLNPHVYLDTVVLLGSVSATYATPWLFALGAAIASIGWFAGLGFGARALAPVFAKPSAWRIFDIGVAVVMTGIAVKLLLGLVG